MFYCGCVYDRLLPRLHFYYYLPLRFVSLSITLSPSLFFICFFLFYLFLTSWGLFYCFTLFTTFTASLQILHDSPRSDKIFKNKNQTKQKGLPRFPPVFLYFPSNQTCLFSPLPRLELCLLHTTLDFQTLKPNQPR
jgi:hypothetical protein